jgi:hypothetical protein
MWQGSGPAEQFPGDGGDAGRIEAVMGVERGGRADRGEFVRHAVAARFGIVLESEIVFLE